MELDSTFYLFMKINLFFNLHFWGLFILGGLPMETVIRVQLVLRQTWVKHAVGMCMEFMTFMAAGRKNFERIFSWRLQICIQLLLEVNPRRRLCCNYKYSGSYRLTYFRKFRWNSLTIVQQTKLTFSFLLTL